MSTSNTQDQPPRLHFLLHAFGFVDKDPSEMEGVLNDFGWEKFTLWFEDVGLPFGLKK